MRTVSPNDRVAAGRTVYLHNGEKFTLTTGTRIKHICAAAANKATGLKAIRSKKGGLVRVHVADT